MSDTPPKAKPTDQPGVFLRDHVYDGIEEFDQKLPNWWLFTLYITIVLFVIYWFLYYQMGWFQSDTEKIDAQIAVLEQKRDAELQKMLATLDDDGLWEMSEDVAAVQAGAKVFEKNCVLCHGEDLGAIGPLGQLPGVALNDTDWVHGGNPMDVFNIINEGSPNTTSGMIAWSTSVSAADIAKVTAFIMSHHTKGEEWNTVPSQYAQPGEGGTSTPPPSPPPPAP